MTSKFGSTDNKNELFSANNGEKQLQGTDSYTYMECNSMQGFIEDATLLSKITGTKLEDTIRSINSNEELMIIDPIRD